LVTKNLRNNFGFKLLQEGSKREYASHGRKQNKPKGREKLITRSARITYD
jgi:hypothetical protein